MRISTQFIMYSYIFSCQSKCEKMFVNECKKHVVNSIRSVEECKSGKVYTNTYTHLHVRNAEREKKERFFFEKEKRF